MGRADREPGAARRVVNLTKRFGEIVAAERRGLEVRRGEIFGFLDPDGAGKTTTLRMMCGLLRPDAGRIEVDARPLIAGAAHFRRRRQRI